MIHLDTNYLIALAVVGSPEAQRVDQWLAAGESVVALKFGRLADFFV